MDQRDSVTRGLEAAHDRALAKKAAGRSSQANTSQDTGAGPRDRRGGQSAPGAAPGTDEERPAQPNTAEGGGCGCG